MPRLIWVSAGRTGHFVGFVVLWLIYYTLGCLTCVNNTEFCYFEAFYFLKLPEKTMVFMYPCMCMPVNSTVKNQRVTVIVFVHSTLSGWDKYFWELSLTLHKYIQSGCRIMTLHSKTDYGRTDGRADKHDVNSWWSLSTGHAMCWRQMRVEKTATVPNVCQNRRPYWTQTLFQFSAFPSPILDTSWNATFAHFMKKSTHLKTGLSSLVLASEWTTNGKKLQINQSISIHLWCQKVATH